MFVSAFPRGPFPESSWPTDSVTVGTNQPEWSHCHQLSWSKAPPLTFIPHQSTNMADHSWTTWRMSCVFFLRFLREHAKSHDLTVCAKALLCMCRSPGGRAGLKTEAELGGYKRQRKQSQALWDGSCWYPEAAVRRYGQKAWGGWVVTSTGLRGEEGGPRGLIKYPSQRPFSKLPALRPLPSWRLAAWLSVFVLNGVILQMTTTSYKPKNRQ